MTLTALVANWFGVTPFSNAGPPSQQQHQERPFLPTKALCEQDLILIDMLNSQGHEQVCFCVCDPDFADCPIVYASPGFCNFTGYPVHEIEGRNCRFLQGPETDAADVARIRAAIQGYTDAAATAKDDKSSLSSQPQQQLQPVSVNLLNYRKDGTSFCNEFFLAPLRSTTSNGKNNKQQQRLQYLIGIQCPVSHLGPGQAPSNPGYVLLYVSLIVVVVVTDAAAAARRPAWCRKR